jgi:hypothetical protein
MVRAFECMSAPTIPTLSLHNSTMSDRAIDCFVIFVVLFDKFDHFEQTFCDINVSIDSLDSPYEGCRDTYFRDHTPDQNFLLKLANNFVFSGVRSVFKLSGNHSFLSRCCVKCNLLFIIHQNHSLVTKMFVKKNSAATRNFHELVWRVLRNFYSISV